MLQEQPVLNLQLDSDLRIAQTPTNIEPIVYDGRTNLTQYGSTGLSRASVQPPTPISTIQFTGSQISNNGSSVGGSRTFLPRFSYEILDEMPSIHIEQTYELNPDLTSVGSENRYTVRSPLGDALFAATESSTARDRTIWGNSRPFQMHLLDKTHQEALTFRRKVPISVFCCQRRCLEVWTPPGDYLGEIVEETSLISSSFAIKMENGDITYKIKPLTNQGACCCLPNEGHFEVVTPDLITSKGSISRKWSTNLSQYTMNIYFSDINMDVKSKALFLGAGFLLEYLCFQSKI